MELCLRLEPGSDLRNLLRDLVLSHPAVTSPGAKWDMLKRARELLLSNSQLFERGCWDFFDTDARALVDFDMWSTGMTTEEGARKGPSGGADPYRQDVRYMTFTIAILMMSGTSADEGIGQVCDIPEDKLWHIETFMLILRNLDMVNFAFVKSDVYYLIPGEESWGLTAADLDDPKFEYLRAIERGPLLQG